MCVRTESAENGTCDTGCHYRLEYYGDNVDADKFLPQYIFNIHYLDYLLRVLSSCTMCLQSQVFFKHLIWIFGHFFWRHPMTSLTPFSVFIQTSFILLFLYDRVERMFGKRIIYMPRIRSGEQRNFNIDPTTTKNIEKFALLQTRILHYLYLYFYLYFIEYWCTSLSCTVATNVRVYDVSVLFFKGVG